MKLAIITGANGALGKAYLNRFANFDNFICVGISRSGIQDKHKKVIYLENVDLLDTENVRAELDKRVPLANAKEILFIHPVGRFKFEEYQKPEIDNDLDGIDDEIYESNINTFTNVKNNLLTLVKQHGKITDFSMCAFGSVSDRYKVPFWLSYSRAKDLLRQDISRMTRQNGGTLNMKGVFINLSSVDTVNENKLRPLADKTFWLKPSEIVDDSSPILFQTRIRNLEMDIFKPIPGFDPKEYYAVENVRQRWLLEMGRTLAGSV